MKTSRLSLGVPLIVLVLSSCSPNATSLQSLADRVAELEAGNKELARQASEQRRQLTAASASRDLAASERARSEAMLKQFHDDASALAAEFAAYKAAYRKAIQMRAKGMKLPDVVMGREVYQNVTVSSATNTELTVVHSQGMAKIQLAEAPQNIKDMFGYDSSLSDTKRQADPVSLALIQSKRLIDNAQKQLDTEEKNAAEAGRRSNFPRSTTGDQAEIADPYSWKRTSSFEGSYYAPINGQKSGYKAPNGIPSAVGTGIK